MQKTLNEYILLPVPTELLDELGISRFSVIQYYAEDGKLIIEPADIDDYECYGECGECPLFDEETGECCDFDYTDEPEDDGNG